MMTYKSIDDHHFDDIMKLLYGQESKPRIGIFWFLPEEHEFIEDYDLLLDYEKEEPTAVYPVLHETFWKEFKNGKGKRSDIDKSVWEKDFKQIPRGRISYHDGKCVVWVGSWYKRCETELSAWLKICFNLTDFEYKVVEYFEIGHHGGKRELEL
ncbi:MAG: hypothetical protein ACLTSL_05150 [Odoribacter splanchnicus]